MIPARTKDKNATKPIQDRPHEECIEVTINKDLYEVLTEKEIEEALGMDQEGQLYSKILPSLMQVAGNNAGIALEMLEALKTHLEESEEVIGAGIEEASEKDYKKAEKAMRKAAKKKFPKDKERQDRYVYGGKRKMGWKPERER